MLTSRIQRPTTPRLSPAALEAAATAFLAEAEGKKASTIRNRGWRSVIQQGPSWEKMSYLGTKTDDEEIFDDTGFDLGIVAASPWRDTVARGNPGRALDRNGWNAIRVLAPFDLPDRDVLEASASQIGGRGQAKAIGKAVGLSDRMVRIIQDRHAAWAAENLDPAALVAALDAGLPPDDVVVPRRVPSRRGRKPRGAQQPRSPRFLVLAPHTPAPSRPRRPYRPRVRRPRFVDFRQMNFLGFEEAV